MPELPEVETVRRGLSELIIGYTIKSVSDDNPKSFPNDAKQVEAFLIGSKVAEIRRRAKVLMIDLSTGYTLVIHLKMTGQLVYRGETAFGAGHPNASLINQLPDRSTRVIISFEEGRDYGLEPSARKRRSAQQTVQEAQSASTAVADAAMDQERWRSFGLRPKAGQRAPRLFFNDQRKFGWMRLMPTLEVPNIDFMKKVGPEPLEADFTPTQFAQCFKRRSNTSIKAALLDQSVIAGVGNIYADESLWGAKIHPKRLVKTVTPVELKNLYAELRLVMNLAIEKGGSTDRNYVNAEGKRGSYMDFARVFRREGKECPRCGTTIIKLRVAGRGTHICPHCQAP